MVEFIEKLSNKEEMPIKAGLSARTGQGTHGNGIMIIEDEFTWASEDCLRQYAEVVSG